MSFGDSHHQLTAHSADRYVDCSSLKRALEAFYGTLLAKGTHPFVYLSLEIDPTKVDVNVHPTKKEVGFEDEDEVVELVCEELAKVLEKQGQSRSYKVQVRSSWPLGPQQTRIDLFASIGQTLLPTAGPPKAAQTMSGTSSSSVPNPTPVRQGSGSSKMPKVAPNKLVRTDAQSQTLDALFPSAPKRPQRNRSSDLQADDEDADAADGANGHAEEERPTKMRKSDHDPAFAARLAADQAAQTRARIRIAQSECALTSVKQLRKEVIEARHEGGLPPDLLLLVSPSADFLPSAHTGLDAIIKGHIFVGVVDLVSCQSVIQHQTKLYLIGHARLA